MPSIPEAYKSYTSTACMRLQREDCLSETRETEEYLDTPGTRGSGALCALVYMKKATGEEGTLVR